MGILVQPRQKSILGAALLLSLTMALGTLLARGEEKHEFRSAGLFVEGCSCSVPCTCDVAGARHGCQGFGALVLSSGSYQGVDLAGAKLAYATVPTQWVRLYVQAKSPQQEEAATEFAKGTFSAFGKIESVKKASIEVTGKDGRYTLSVDGGKIMQLTTEPVLGGDKKTPITYSNIFNPVTPSVRQAKTLKGSYQDGDRSFALEGSNAFFNADARKSGKI